MLDGAFTRHGETDADSAELTYHSEVAEAFYSGQKVPRVALGRLGDYKMVEQGCSDNVRACWVQWRADTFT
jgi:hypothetical protein